MALIRSLGTKSQTLGGVTADLTATLEQDDSGQIFIRVAGTVGNDKYESKSSIGAADGNDALSKMAPIEIGGGIQADLDRLRQEVAQKLRNTAAVKGIAATLT